MAKKRNAIVDFAVYVPVRSVFFALAWLPERLAYGSVACLGRIFFVLARKRRKIALANLKQAMGEGAKDKELRKIGSRACGANFKVLVDMARLPRILAAGRFWGLVDATELHKEREAALERHGDKPVIFCTPHLGSWEAGLEGAGQIFGEMNVIARPLANPWLHRLMFRIRHGAKKHIYPRRGGIRAVARALREGGNAVFLPDQNQRLRGVFVPFFGKEASCDRSAMSLSRLGGYPIFVLAMIRVGPGFRFRYRVSEVFHVTDERDQDKDCKLRGGILRLNKAMERLILEEPEQYFWLHDRFRTRPGPSSQGPDTKIDEQE